MARVIHTLLKGLLLAPGLVGVAYAAPAPQTAWSTALKVPVYNTPQERDGQVYLTSIQSSGPNVFAIDSSTGKPLWTFATQGSIAIPPTVGPTQVFVASDVGNTHFMRAIDVKTGQLIWTYTRDQPPECMCSYQSTLTGGLLFAQTDGHSLYAFEPSGAVPSKRLWSFDGDGALLTKPVLADGVVVVGSSERRCGPAPPAMPSPPTRSSMAMSSSSATRAAISTASTSRPANSYGASAPAAPSTMLP
jgi:outer membrane protein assembly factor BamB